LAERPVRKRAVAASGAVSGEAPKRKGFRVPPAAAPAPEEEAPTENYALRLTEALEAISSAQLAAAPASADTRPASGGPLAALDRLLPPIRLPLGPPIPWRYGLPALLALVVFMALLSRPTAHAESSSGFKLPAESETYPVTQDSPLFTNAQQRPSQPIGVPEPPGLGVDLVDLTLKLVAVLALAYGSLVLLKRAGFGGATAAKPSGSPQAMRVVSSVVLAPNRTVHVLRVPGGRTLLVGATPNAVNLIADLGELAETDTPEAASFFDVLKGKL
jgi:flagellar biogenesis protein FliO